MPEIDGVDRRVFITSYIDAALNDVSTSCGIAEECDQDCSGGHSPVSLSWEELSAETRKRLETDAGEFFDAHAADLAKFPGDHAYDRSQWADRGGYYFWMTRSGHGVGFGDWYTSGGLDPATEEARGRLSEACRTEGERELYRGDDDKIHHMQSWGEVQRERAGR